MQQHNCNNKVLVLGVDGMDPVLTTTYLKREMLPNLQTYIDKGACREDLAMLGAMHLLSSCYIKPKPIQKVQEPDALSLIWRWKRTVWILQMHRWEISLLKISCCLMRKENWP